MAAGRSWVLCSMPTFSYSTRCEDAKIEEQNAYQPPSSRHQGLGGSHPRGPVAGEVSARRAPVTIPRLLQGSQCTRPSLREAAERHVAQLLHDGLRVQVGRSILSSTQCAQCTDSGPH